MICTRRCDVLKEKDECPFHHDWLILHSYFCKCPLWVESYRISSAPTFTVDSLRECVISVSRLAQLPPMLSALRDFLNAFFVQAKSVLAPFSSLEIVQQDDDQLILKNNSRQFIVSKRYRTVKSGTRVLARFDAIETIDVAHLYDDDEPEYWSVRLNVKGSFLPVIIGHTLNDVDASIVAARISTLTGKKVRVRSLKLPLQP